MHKNLKRISTIDLTREQWLDHRRKSIGGSDAASIIGLNPYAGAYTVWADKTGRLLETEGNEAMRQGRDLESYVASRWSEATGKKVRSVNAILANLEYPFAHANVDRLVVGESAGLECKTTSSLNLKKFKGGEYPESYYVQCVHYMAVTGAERWYLAVLVLGREFYTFTIERDEDEINALMAQEQEFWRCVTSDIPPMVDGAPATTEALETIYAESNGGEIELFGREKLLTEYHEQKAVKATIEARMEEIKQLLMSDLGENEAGNCGTFRVTWKPQTRNTFNAKSFTADHPAMDLSGYYNSTTFRKFEIKEIG